MSSVSEQDAILPFGQPAPVVRFFGWASLFVLAAFLINNILIVWFGFPPLGSVMAGGADPKVAVILGIYIVALLGAGYWVWHSGNTALRYDARSITAFNAYLIRACFFAVLFVGIVDVIIASLFRRANLRSRYAADGGQAWTGSSLRNRWMSSAKLTAVS